ncbi:myb/SANT-like DNA-binding domain-containing protein 3 isoform X2 [Ixodes scapularis]|uniref:myb/SANT-like DNA-binding domain-containing protein 3 isoform X2 n=1 Tax=Ixodes scapularis TaxID=6945 RepID=UPI001C384E42|nr:myb/SANT-like DNA-binding domain-containing protein 3 isoform X2 [Ixodes scapularis]
MATKKKQSPRFTADEISILSGLVGKHKTIIECKKTDSVSSNLKNETWEKLCNEYNCLPGVSPRDSNQLKKCWGNLKQKWKNERSDEKRKTHKTGGGPPPTPMSAISVLVGAVAGHMATRLDNDNDSDGAAYLPPVQNEPVVRLLEGMIDCDPVYEYAAMRTREQEAAVAAAAQMNLLKRSRRCATS